jgi:hypothetical protein
MAIRSSMHGVGGVLLERLLDSDSGYRGPRVPCQQGHQAEFIEGVLHLNAVPLTAARVSPARQPCATVDRAARRPGFHS